jgi:hypothetical protein
MRPLPCALALSLAALVTGAGQAATARDQLIRPGVGLAELRLGMSQAQVRRAKGAPQAIVRRTQGYGRTVLELQYGYGSYNVLLSGRKGRERVIALTTFFAGEQTAKGVGVNVLESRAARAYPALRCDPFRAHRVGSKYAFKGLRRVCTLGDRDEPQTVFLSKGPVEQVEGTVVGANPPIEQSWPRQATVYEIIVRVPGYTHPDEDAARRL